MNERSPKWKRRLTLLCLAVLLLVGSLAAVFLDTVRSLAETVAESRAEADKSAGETVPSSDEYWQAFSGAESIPYEVESAGPAPEGTPAAGWETESSPEGRTEPPSESQSAPEDPSADTSLTAGEETAGPGSGTGTETQTETETQSEAGTEPEETLPETTLPEATEIPTPASTPAPTPAPTQRPTQRPTAAPTAASTVPPTTREPESTVATTADAQSKPFQSSTLERVVRTWSEYYDNASFGIPLYMSGLDRDGDGIDDQIEFVNGARRFLSCGPVYDGGIVYSTGYAPLTAGTRSVCSDVFAYAMLEAGYDIRRIVFQDLNQAGSSWYPMARDDDYTYSAVTFRRVRNLYYYLKRMTLLGRCQELTSNPSDYTQWQPGDIVIFYGDSYLWDGHIAVVSDRRAGDGVPFILHHHDTAGEPEVYEEDVLLFYYGYGRIAGHFRFSTGGYFVSTVPEPETTEASTEPETSTEAPAESESSTEEPTETEQETSTEAPAESESSAEEPTETEQETSTEAPTESESSTEEPTETEQETSTEAPTESESSTEEPTETEPETSTEAPAETEAEKTVSGETAD